MVKICPWSITLVPINLDIGNKSHYLLKRFSKCCYNMLIAWDTWAYKIQSLELYVDTKFVFSKSYYSRVQWHRSNWRIMANLTRADSSQHIFFFSRENKISVCRTTLLRFKPLEKFKVWQSSFIDSKLCTTYLQKKNKQLFFIKEQE